MPVDIKSTRDVQFDGVKCAIYGRSGIGKTPLAATAPKPFIISAEHGLLSVASKDIPFAVAESLTQVDEIYKHVSKSEDIETIFIDTVSEIADILIGKLLKGVKDNRQAYAQAVHPINTMIRNFRSIRDKNVVFVCKEKKVFDDEGDLIGYEPWLPGKVIPEGFPYLVDEVFSMQVDRKGKKFLQTQPDRKRECKDRSCMLDAQEYGTGPNGEINLTEIFEKIRIGIEKLAKENQA